MKATHSNNPASGHNTEGRQKYQRFRLSFIFTLLAIVAGVLFIARTAATANPLPTSDRYHVDATSILDTDHAKVVQYRIESNSPFYATVNHGQGRTAAASSFSPSAKTHVIEIVVFLDHIASRECVKECLTVGAAGGSGVESVSKDYALNKNTKIKLTGGTYKRNETVELLQWNGRTYSLSLGK
ncbi:MAG: hypothetical protein H8E44_18675 [Planctomycetes bacterium]|nr:hypothetical protein [Planctomycetota bacterium]MBL7044940.1 hypothetical protein [Pirellulaceae bacterium]